MAEIITRKGPNGLRYYARYIDADGVRRMKKAPGEGMPRAEGMRAARAWLAAIEKRIADGKVGIIPDPTPEEIATRKATEAVEEAKRAVTLGAIFDRFIAEYRPAKVQGIHKYRVQTRSIFRANVPADLQASAAASVKPRDLVALRDRVIEAKSTGTAVAVLRVLSKLYKWALAVEAIDCANPCAGIERPTVDPSLDYLDKGEAGRLLAYVEEHAANLDKGLHAMVAVAVYAGLRKGELHGLRWRDLDLDARRLTVARSYLKVPKSGKPRHVPINPALVPTLRTWKDHCPATEEGLVFPVAGERKVQWRMGRTDTMHGLADVLKAAGCHVPAKPWHALRHTFASHFMMAGGNILTLQKLMGHQKLEMTMIYAHLAPDFMAAEVGRMAYPRPTADNVTDLAEARRQRDAEDTGEGALTLAEAAGS